MSLSAVTPEYLKAAKDLAGGASLKDKMGMGYDLTALMMASMQLKQEKAKLEGLQLMNQMQQKMGGNPQAPTTVAQDVDIQKQQIQAQLGGQPQQAMPPQDMPQEQQEPQQPQEMSGGLASLPAVNFNDESFVGGGIVAFEEGGVAHGAESLYVDSLGNAMTKEEAVRASSPRLLGDSSGADYYVDEDGNVRSRAETKERFNPRNRNLPVSVEQPLERNLPSTRVIREIKDAGSGSTTRKMVPNTAPTQYDLGAVRETASKVGRILSSPAAIGVQGALYSGDVNANEPYQRTTQKPGTKENIAGNMDVLGEQLDATNQEIQEVTNASRGLGGLAARKNDPTAASKYETLQNRLVQLERQRSDLQREYELSAKASGLNAVTGRGQIANPTMQKNLTGIATQTPQARADATQTPQARADAAVTPGSVLDKPVISGSSGGEKPNTGQFLSTRTLQGDPQTVANEIEKASPEDQAGIRAQWKAQHGADLPPASGKGTATAATTFGKPVAEDDLFMQQLLASQKTGSDLLKANIRVPETVKSTKEYADEYKVGEDAFLKAQGMPTNAESLKTRTDRLAKEGEQARKDRDVDRWLAAAQGFFAMGAGQSPYALQNIAAGLGVTTKELKGVEADYRKGVQLRADKTDLLKEAARQEALGHFSKAEGFRKDAEKRNDEISKNNMLIGEKLLSHAATTMGTIQAKRSAESIRKELAAGRISQDEANRELRASTEARREDEGKDRTKQNTISQLRQLGDLERNREKDLLASMPGLSYAAATTPEARKKFLDTPAGAAFEKQLKEIRSRAANYDAKIANAYGDSGTSGAANDPLGILPPKK